MGKKIYWSCLTTSWSRPHDSTQLNSRCWFYYGSLQASGGWDTSNCHSPCNHKCFPKALTPQDLHTNVSERALMLHWFRRDQRMMLRSSENQTQESGLLCTSRYWPLPKANWILLKAASLVSEIPSQKSRRNPRWATDRQFLCQLRSRIKRGIAEVTFQKRQRG